MSAPKPYAGPWCAFCKGEPKPRKLKGVMVEGELKRCSTCKSVYYCSKECQNAAWKKHKKKCVKEPDLIQIREMVAQARIVHDWPAILVWQHKMEILLALAGHDEERTAILREFGTAFFMTGNYPQAVLCHERKVEILGDMQRFRDQGWAMVQVADALRAGGDLPLARTWCVKALALAREHGFFETECNACEHLAAQDIEEGRVEEGIEMLRYALTVTDFVEDDEKAKFLELAVLRKLFEALLEHSSGENEELVPLLERFDLAVKASAEIEGLEHYEFLGHDLRARLHHRRGDTAKAEEELKIMHELAAQKPRAAGVIFGVGHNFAAAAAGGSFADGTPLRPVEPAARDVEKEMIEMVEDEEGEFVEKAIEVGENSEVGEGDGRIEA